MKLFKYFGKTLILKKTLTFVSKIMYFKFILILFLICHFSVTYSQNTNLDTAFAYYFNKSTNQDKYCKALVYFEKAMQQKQLDNYPMYYAAQSACQCGDVEKSGKYFKMSFAKTIDFYNYNFFASDTLNKCFSDSKEWKNLIQQMKYSYDSVQQVKRSYITKINDTNLRINHVNKDIKKLRYDIKNKNSSEIIKTIQHIEFQKPLITNHWTLYTIQNTQGEKIPFLLYIPYNYDHHKETPLFVYLHGATNRKEFSYNQHIPEQEKATLDYLASLNTFIIYPFAKKNYNWVDNLTMLKIIMEEIKFVKSRYNIQDNQVYIGGHSDGARGTLWFALYNRTPFAGFYGFALPLSLLIDETHFQNLQNTQPFIFVNAIKDEIFNFSKIRNIYDSYQSQNLNWMMKTVEGEHHFMPDFPKVIKETYDMILKRQRNTMPSNLIIQVGKNDSIQNHWIKINKTLSEPEKIVKASYQNNQFIVSTKGIQSLSILIPYGMVNYQKDIKVLINGQQKSFKLQPDKNTIIKYFFREYDRKFIITNELIIQIQ